MRIRQRIPPGRVQKSKSPPINSARLFIDATTNDTYTLDHRADSACKNHVDWR
jgi:hypothetical protein